MNPEGIKSPEELVAHLDAEAKKARVEVTQFVRSFDAQGAETTADLPESSGAYSAEEHTGKQLNRIHEAVGKYEAWIGELADGLDKSERDIWANYQTLNLHHNIARSFEGHWDYCDELLDQLLMLVEQRSESNPEVYDKWMKRLRDEGAIS